jgi:hypothetical protein
MMEPLKFEDWLDQVRVEIYDRTRDMTPEQALEDMHARAQRVADEIGITIQRVPIARPAHPLLPKAHGS